MLSKVALCFLAAAARCVFAQGKIEPANLIITNANVLTVDSHFSRAEAVALREDRIVFVGSNREVERYAGPATRAIDARGKTVLSGLCDSHVHSYRAAVSEFGARMPVLTSLAQAFAYVREQAATQPRGSWIVLERVYPTRMKEGRLPTKSELDQTAPDNPVYWNCGSVSMANSKALGVSGITRDTPDPLPGEIVKDPRTRLPTGLLRNAAQMLKVSSVKRQPSPEELRAAVKHLYQLYNQQGITSIAERRTDFASIDLFRDLARQRELNVRINCTRMMDPPPKTLAEAKEALEEMTHGPDGKGDYGPTAQGPAGRGHAYWHRVHARTLGHWRNLPNH